MTGPPVGWVDSSHLPILLVIGLAIVFGTIGAKLFQRLRIPQVVAYIAIGFVAGRSVLEILDEQTIRRLQPFSFFALGVIGFMIGGELRLELLRKYGKSFLIILLSEGLGAFLCVAAAVSSACMLLTGNVGLSAALGIVLGAISSATAPAATVDVLWEYKTRGILTTTVFALVAMDDALALLLYAVAATVVSAMFGASGGEGAAGVMGHVVYELAGAVALGSAAGLLLNLVLRRTRDHEKTLPFTIGSLALLIGCARMLGVDLILSTMTFGALLVNLAPRRSRAAFDTVQGVAAPIYVLFFVIVGARLYVSGMAYWMWVLAAAYVVGRTAGKMLGANLGARWSRSSAAVRKYLGLCLFSQAGVAIGLAILAADRLPGRMGAAIMMIVTSTTFLVQIIGPPCVKLAASRAGEVGLNVTEQDLLTWYTAADMVDRSVPVLKADTTLAEIIHTVGETDAMSYPVVDDGGKLIGVITLDHLRRSFLEEELAKVLLAFDLMEPPPEAVAPDVPLAEAESKMREQGLDYLPVVASKDHPRLVGLIDQRGLRRRLSEEIIRRRQTADAGLGQPAPTGSAPHEAT